MALAARRMPHHAGPARRHRVLAWFRLRRQGRESVGHPAAFHGPRCAYRLISAICRSPSSATTRPRRIHAYLAWVVGAASTLSASHRSIHSRNSMVGGRGNARDELGSIAAYTRARVPVHLVVLLGRDGLDVGRAAKTASRLGLL